MLLHPKHGNTLKFPKFKLKLKRFRAKGLPLELGCWFTSLDSNFFLTPPWLPLQPILLPQMGSNFRPFLMKNNHMSI